MHGDATWIGTASLLLAIAAGCGDAQNDAGGSSTGGNTTGTSVGGSASGGGGQNMPLALTDALQLSPDNAAPGEAKDEDSHIIRSQSGRYFVTWMSNRADGNDDVYVMHSDDAVAWSAPIRVTEHSDADWYPTLLEDETGRFHLAWMRQQITPPYARHIVYTSSANGTDWDVASEVALTDGMTDDFLPFLVAHDGNLFIYFGSRERSANQTEDLFFMLSSDGGGSWSEPALLGDLSTSDQMDTFPYVMAAPEGGLLMTFVRYDGNLPTPEYPYLPSYNGPTTDQLYSTSSDGLSWSAPVQVTSDASDGVTDSLGAAYAVRGSTRLTWMQGVDASPHIVDFAVADVATYPDGIIDTTAANGVPGWSPRVAPTHTDDVFIRTWVSADKRIFYQVFAR